MATLETLLRAGLLNQKACSFSSPGVATRSLNTFALNEEIGWKPLYRSVDVLLSLVQSLLNVSLSRVLFLKEIIFWLLFYYDLFMSFVEVKAS